MNEPSTSSRDPLEQEIEALKGAMTPISKRPAWRLPAGLILITAVLLAIAGWFNLNRTSTTPALIYQLHDNKSDTTWIDTAISRTLATQLELSEQAVIVNAGASSPWRGTELDRDDIASSTGASWGLQTGLSEESDGSLLLNIVLSDLSEGGPDESISIRGSSTAISDLTARASTQILKALNRTATGNSSADFPAQSDIGKAYIIALDALEIGDAQSALDALNVSLKKAPDNALLLSARSRAWTQLGYSEKASKDANAAFANKVGLSRENELELEALSLEAADNWQASADIWRALLKFYPNNLGYGLQLVKALTQADQFDAAMLAVQSLKQLPPPLNADPRIDLYESHIHTRAGRYVLGVSTADKALARAREIRAPMLIAEIQLAAAGADADDKQQRLEEARSIYADTENPRGEATALKELGDLLLHKGGINEAIRLYEDSITIAKGAGNPRQQAASQNALSIAYDLQGDLTKGYATKLLVANYYADRGVKSRHSIMLENIGISLFKLGRYEEALDSFDEALQIFEEIGDEIGIAWAPYHRGRIRARQGDLETATKLIQQAIENSQTRPEGNLEINAQYEAMLIATLAGQSNQALAQAQSISQRYTEMELFLDAGETDTLIARNALILGDLVTAEKALTRASIALNDAGAGYYSASAQLGLVDVALSGAVDLNTADTCAALADLVRPLQHKLIKLRAEVRQVACRIWTTDAVTVTDLKSLEDIAHEASELQLFEPAFEAMEVHARALALMGDNAAAISEIEALNKLANDNNWRNASFDCLTEPPSKPCQLIASSDN